MRKMNAGCQYCNWLLFYITAFLLTGLMVTTTCCFAQDTSMGSPDLKKRSLEELMNMEVTSASKRPEKLKDAASGTQVITQKDIRNSGEKTLAEALRLAPNLQVAYVNFSHWTINARGFDNVPAIG